MLQQFQIEKKNVGKRIVLNASILQKNVKEILQNTKKTGGDDVYLIQLMTEEDNRIYSSDNRMLMFIEALKIEGDLRG